MNSPVEYEQTDPRWRNIIYSTHGDPSQTIGNSGCGPTCAAMVVATLRNRNITPVQAAAWAVAKGYLSWDDGTYWNYFLPYLSQYGIPCTRTNSKDLALAALRKDRMVISAMGAGHWTSGGHFILAYELAGERVKIHDPNSEASYRELGDLNNYLNEAKQYWIIEEVWKVQIKALKVKDLDSNANVAVTAINVDGHNYVRLRDMELLAPVKIGNEGATPTIRLEDGMERWEYVKDVPAGYYRQQVERLMKEGVLKGKADGTIDLTEDMLRTILIAERLKG